MVIEIALVTQDPGGQTWAYAAIARNIEAAFGIAQAIFASC